MPMRYSAMCGATTSGSGPAAPSRPAVGPSKLQSRSAPAPLSSASPRDPSTVLVDCCCPPCMRAAGRTPAVIPTLLKLTNGSASAARRLSCRYESLTRTPNHEVMLLLPGVGEEDPTRSRTLQRLTC